MKLYLVLGRILLIELNCEFFMKFFRFFFYLDGVDRVILVYVFEDWFICISILFVVLFDILGVFCLEKRCFVLFGIG